VQGKIRKRELAMQVKQILAWATAVLLAAVAVGLLHGLLGVVNPLLGSDWFDQLFFVGFGFALVIAIVIGVPVALIYRWRGWTNPIAVLIGGFLIGVLPYCLFFLIDFSPVALSDFKPIAMFGGYGASGALVFWLTLRAFGALPAARLPR
jgi:hypothetical protein